LSSQNVPITPTVGHCVSVHHVVGGVEVKITDSDVMKASSNQAMWYLKAFADAQKEIVFNPKLLKLRAVIVTNLNLWTVHVWLPLNQNQLRVASFTTTHLVEVVSVLWQIGRMQDLTVHDLLQQFCQLEQ
jgi:hypothetical protein